MEFANQELKSPSKSSISSTLILSSRGAAFTTTGGGGVIGCGTPIGGEIGAPIGGGGAGIPDIPGGGGIAPIPGGDGITPGIGGGGMLLQEVVVSSFQEEVLLVTQAVEES